MAVKIPNKCAHCERIASRKYSGEWVCLAHLGTPAFSPTLPEVRPYRKGIGAIRDDPDRWKKYNREYRSQYRLTHERSDKKPTIYWRPNIKYYYYNNLWFLEGLPYTQEQAFYHCESCCNSVIVTKKEVNREKKRHYANTDYWYWYKGGRYSNRILYEVDLSAALKHVCKEYPYKKIKFVKCDRCGIEGSSRTIHPYYSRDTLCPDCWQTVRAFYRKEHEYQELMNTLSKFRSAMRKSGFNISHGMKVNEGWAIDQGMYWVYRENWHKYRHDEKIKGIIAYYKEQEREA